MDYSSFPHAVIELMLGADIAALIIVYEDKRFIVNFSKHDLQTPQVAIIEKKFSKLQANVENDFESVEMLEEWLLYPCYQQMLQLAPPIISTRPPTATRVLQLSNILLYADE